MASAKLPEATPVLRAALDRVDAPTFERTLFDWVERAADARPTALWLLNDAYEALSHFGKTALPIPMSDGMDHRFRQTDGLWTASLANNSGQQFCLPLSDGRRTIGLMEFGGEAAGIAWRRTVACLVQIYLAQRHQRQERAALERMLMQMRASQAASQRRKTPTPPQSR